MGSTAILFVSLAVSTGPIPQETGTATILQPSIYGTWKVVSAHINGQEDKEHGGMIFKFSPKKVQVKAFTFDCRIDTTTNPKRVDIEAFAQTNGIYKIEGNMLTLCCSNGKAPRPRRFVTKAGDRNWLVVLKRVEEAASDK